MSAYQQYCQLQNQLLLELSEEISARQHVKDLLAAKTELRGRLYSEIQLKQQEYRELAKLCIVQQNEEVSVIDSLNFEKAAAFKKKEALEEKLKLLNQQNCKLKKQKQQHSLRIRDRTQKLQNARQESALEEQKQEAKRKNLQRNQEQLDAAKAQKASLEAQLQKAVTSEAQIQTAIRQLSQAKKGMAARLQEISKESERLTLQQNQSSGKLFQLKEQELQLYRRGREVGELILAAQARSNSSKGDFEVMVEESLGLREVREGLTLKIRESESLLKQGELKIWEAKCRIRELQQFQAREKERETLLRNKLQLLKTTAIEAELQRRRMARRGHVLG